MTDRFIDEYLPDCVVGWESSGAPVTSTYISAQDNGQEIVDQRWSRPLWRFRLSPGTRELPLPHELAAHWLVMSGPAHTFPYRDPMDHATADVTRPGEAPTVTPTDQQIGIGDGTTATFQLIKTYTVGSSTFDRKIYLPVVDTVRIAIDDVEVAESSDSWSVDRETGIVTFYDVPNNNEVITAGFLFDCEVRYGSDEELEVAARALRAASFAEITLLESRPC